MRGNEAQLSAQRSTIGHIDATVFCHEDNIIKIKLRIHDTGLGGLDQILFSKYVGLEPML